MQFRVDKESLMKAFKEFEPLLKTTGLYSYYQHKKVANAKNLQFNHDQYDMIASVDGIQYNIECVIELNKINNFMFNVEATFCIYEGSKLNIDNAVCQFTTNEFKCEVLYNE